MTNLIQCSVTDRGMKSTRYTTDAGFLVARAHLANVGVQPYLRGELQTADGKGLGGNPRDLIRLMRMPEDVFAPDAIASAESAPLTIGHPKGGVTSKNYTALNKGDVRDCKREEGDLLGATVIAKAEDAIDAITKKNMTALSAGYTFALDLTPGTHNGVAFDGFQRNIRINHVAIVDVARGGPDCRVLDGTTNNNEEDTHMIKLVLNGKVFEAEDGLAAEITTLQTGVATATAAKVAADDALKAEQKKLTEALAEIERLKKTTVTDDVIELRASERAGLLSAADRLGVKVEAKGKTSKALRQEILTGLVAKDEGAKTVVLSVLGATKIEAADDATLAVLVTTLAASRPAAQVNTQDAIMSAIVSSDDAVRTVRVGDDGDGMAALGATPVNTKTGPVKAADGSTLYGREAMIERINYPSADQRR